MDRTTTPKSPTARIRLTCMCSYCRRRNWKNISCTVIIHSILCWRHGGRNVHNRWVFIWTNV